MRPSRAVATTFIWFDNFTLHNINFVFFELSATKLALQNTFILGVWSATVGTLLALVISYLTTRRAIAGHRTLGFLATAPVAIPGIVLGVGLFLSYARPPFVLYGTLWILFLAFVTIALPAAYQQLQSAFRSVHTDLEDASRILGATRLRTLRDITAPLLRTSVIATWCFIFVGVIRELSAAIMLFTSETKVISVLIFDLNEFGRSRRHLGARHHHAGDHLCGRHRGQSHSRLRRRAPAQHLTRHGRRLPATSVAEILADKIAAIDPAQLPPRCAANARIWLIDVVGLCLAARNEDYVKAALAGWDEEGRCTAIGHARTLSAAAAAFVNGTAAHGEDFDDTFEGGPVHAGAVIVPAVLAACERHDPRWALRRSLGIAVGVEAICRLSLVVPKAVHKAGFHPTAVFGAIAAAAGVAAALKLTGGKWSMRSASPARWRAASSNISPKAPGPSGCIPAGRRNRACARRCSRARALSARARVFEGVHGLFHGFARTSEGDYDALDRRFRRALGDGDARLQALSVRDHDASLYRLRAPAGCARHRAPRR